MFWQQAGALMSSDSVIKLWADYQRTVSGDAKRYDSWYFADTETDADELAELVLAGIKRATASALWAFEFDREPVPKPGDFSVVTNWRGVAACIIRTTAVEVVPYNEVTAVFAEIEGEGDKSLAYWRSVHWPYYQREMLRIGRELSPTLPVVCQHFERVYP